MIGETKELRLRFREGREAEKTVCRPLFLMADESETMLARYLDRARLFVAEAADEGNVLNVGIVASALVTNEGGGVAELKNLAVAPDLRGRGVGRRMIEAVREACAGRFRTLRVGTGAGTPTVRFYEKCGFREVGRIPEFFTENYPEPIWEEGVLLCDMAVLEMPVGPSEHAEPTDPADP